jgi:hypothetical protein
MSELTFGYCYYEDIDRFNYVLDYYTSDSIFDKIPFIVVDDGSKKYPLKKEELPNNWTLYKIKEDVGWNNEGARNLVMHVVKTKYAALLDCDFIMEKDEFKFLLEIEKDLDENTLYFFIEKYMVVENSLGASNVNLWNNRFIISKKYFWELGGYDESLRYYGSDASITQHPKLNYDRLEIYIKETKFKESISIDYFNRFEENVKLNIERLKLKRKGMWPNSERLRFNWEKV